MVPYFQLLELEEYHSYGILEAQATESKALCLTQSNQKQSNFNTRVVCLEPRVKPLMLVRVRPLTHVSLIFLKKKKLGTSPALARTVRAMAIEEIVEELCWDEEEEGDDDDEDDAQSHEKGEGLDVVAAPAASAPRTLQDHARQAALAGAACLVHQDSGGAAEMSAQRLDDVTATTAATAANEHVTGCGLSRKDKRAIKRQRSGEFE